MKNMLKEEKGTIIAILILSILTGAFISLVPACFALQDLGFTETLKTSIPIAILSIIIIWITTFSVIKRFSNLKNKVIQKFNLKEGDYVEVNVVDTFTMEEDIETLANAIKRLDSSSNIASAIIIDGEEIKIAFDNIKPSFDVLISIIKRLNGKFFIYLDSKNKVTWCLVNSSSRIICRGYARCEAEYFQILNCFEVK